MSFDEFWNICWRKEAKQDALKSYNKAVPSLVSHKDFMEGVRRYLDELDKNETARKFQKLPATWINKGCYEDVYQPKKHNQVMAEIGTVNEAVRAGQHYRDLQSSIWEQWSKSGSKHWWHVAQRMKQAWGLSILRAAVECGGNLQEKLREAELVYSTGKLPDDLRLKAELQEKMLGDPTER